MTQTILLTPDTWQKVKSKTGTLMFPNDFWEITDYLTKDTKKSHNIQRAYIKTTPREWDINKDYTYTSPISTDKGFYENPFGDVYVWQTKRVRETMSYDPSVCDPNGEFSEDCWVDNNA